PRSTRGARCSCTTPARAASSSCGPSCRNPSRERPGRSCAPSCGIPRRRARTRSPSRATRSSCGCRYRARAILPRFAITPVMANRGRIALARYSGDPEALELAIQRALADLEQLRRRELVAGHVVERAQERLLLVEVQADGIVVGDVPGARFAARHDVERLLRLDLALGQAGHGVRAIDRAARRALGRDDLVLRDLRARIAQAARQVVDLD